MSSKTTVGVQYNRRSQVYGAETGTGLPPGSQTVVGAAAVTATELHAIAVVAGGYVEQELGWRDRLFATAALRMDGASTFGSDLNAAVYPKFSVSWLASEDPHFPKLPGISSLRFRGAFGSSGVQPPSTASVTTVTLISGFVNGGSASGVTAGAFGNSRVGPERQSEVEGGIDLEGSEGRVKLELTGYSRKSTDALVQVPFALSAGGGTTYQNVGSVTNRGLEGLLNLRVIDRQAIGFDLTLNGSTNANKLAKVNPNAPPGFFTSYGAIGTRHRLGYPLYGAWQKPILSYADQNGDGILVPSEIVVGDTEVFMGSSSPTKHLAATGALSAWRDLVRIAALFDWHGGYKQLDYTGFSTCSLFINCPELFVRGQSMLAQQAAIQAYIKAGTQWGYITNGTFTRLRELSLTVRMPQRALTSVGASAGSLTLAGRNLKFWSDWLGGDPDVNAGTGTDLVYTLAAPPLPRYLIARVNLSF